jgi:hypothetical protein
MSIVRKQRAGGLDSLVGTPGGGMRIFMGTILAAALVMFADPGFAAPACGGPGGYAEVAVNDAQEAIRLGCGWDPNEPRWSTDFNVHYSWCVNASADAVWGDQGEYKIRRRQLSRCSQCRDYANQAKAAVDQNTELHCNQTGDRWNPDPEAHFNWCMGLSNGETDILSFTWFDDQCRQETDARNAAIGACYIAHPPKIGQSQSPLTVEQPCASGETRLPSNACCAKTMVSACGECCAAGQAPNAATGTCLLAVTQPASQVPPSQTPSPEVPR